MLEQIRIVLVEPSHPGNIGGVARAMKNMGLSQLVLVAPKRFPDDEATARASGADDVLVQAQVVATLDEALAGCHWVAGTTSRARYIDWPLMAPRAAAATALAETARGPVALVFGRERDGLSNAELDRCQAGVSIPANPVYPSLNLACAVQVLVYELYTQALDRQEEGEEAAGEASLTPVPADDMERFFTHLEQVLVELEFLNPEHPKKLMRRLRRLFHRAAPAANEMNILRGILTAVQDQRRRYTRPS